MNKSKLKEKMIYSLTHKDLQMWAKEEIGRKLNDNEFETLLDEMIEDGIFSEIQLQIVEIINKINNHKVIN